jgi:hypothetical protein
MLLRSFVFPRGPTIFSLRIFLFIILFLEVYCIIIKVLMSVYQYFSATFLKDV